VEATLRQGQRTATGIVNITVNGAPLHASMAVTPNGSIPVNVKDELSANSRQSVGFMTIGRFSREAKADVSLQPADDFDSTGFASLRPPLKPNDSDLVLENVRPGRYWLRVDPYRGYVASAVAGSVDLLRQPLVVGPGGASLPIDIVLRDDGAEIEGIVEGMTAASGGARGTASGGPVPLTAYVYCIPLPDSPGRFTVSVGSLAKGTSSCSNSGLASIAFLPSTASRRNSNIRIRKPWQSTKARDRSSAWPPGKPSRCA
jgi:hypothetical protein